MGQFVLYFNGTEYNCPGRATTTTFSGTISVETFAKYPNYNENLGNKDEFENDFDLLFIIKKTLDLRTTLYHHEMEFTAQEAIFFASFTKLSTEHTKMIRNKSSALKLIFLEKS